MNSSIISSRIAVSLFFFINGTLLSSWIPHIPLIKEQLGLSEGLLGTALFSMAIGAVISMSACGYAIQRFGSKNITIWSASTFCLSMPLPILAPSFTSLIAALFIFGACNGAMDVAMNAQAVIVEKNFKRPIMSSFHGFFSIGGLLGSSIGGLALANGINQSNHVLIICFMIFPAILFFQKHLVTDKTEKIIKRSKKQLKPNGRLLGLGMLAFLVLVAEGSVADWSSVYIKQALQSGPGFVAAGYASFSTMMALGRFMGDRYVANVGPVLLSRMTSLLAAIGLVVVLIIPHPVTVILGFGCIGLGLSNLIPVLFSSAGTIPGVPSGQGIAAVASAGYFGFLAGPPVIGGFAEVTSLKTALFMVVVAVFIVTIFANLTEHEHACEEPDTGEKAFVKKEITSGEVIS